VIEGEDSHGAHSFAANTARGEPISIEAFYHGSPRRSETEGGMKHFLPRISQINTNWKFVTGWRNHIPASSKNGANNKFDSCRPFLHSARA
jgi:hypothetical protein